VTRCAGEWAAGARSLRLGLRRASWTRTRLELVIPIIANGGPKPLLLVTKARHLVGNRERYARISLNRRPVHYRPPPLRLSRPRKVAPESCSRPYRKVAHLRHPMVGMDVTATVRSHIFEEVRRPAAVWG
jgi:hypothetical protein